MSEPLSEPPESSHGTKAVRGPRKQASKAARPRSADPSSVEADVVALFARHLGDLTDNMAALAAGSARFATAGSEGRVIDLEAVVAAMLAAEQHGGLPTASIWLQQWAKQQGLAFALRPTADPTDARPQLSILLAYFGLKRAVEVRDATMNGKPEPVGARHLLFALAEQSPEEWPLLSGGGRISAELLAELRALVVARTGYAPLKSEDMGAWQALLAGPTTPPPPPAERTPLLSDSPATVDELGRKPLADALAARLVRLQRDEAASAQPKAVMVHLHGPWGSGKSSLVRFLEDTLKAQDPPWLVV
jgi:hypothetical protein